VALSPRVLGQGEEVVADVRPHWSFLGWSVVCTIASVALSVSVVVLFPSAPIGLLYVLFALIATSALWMATRWVRRASIAVVVTNARVLRRAGVLSRTNLEIRLERINELWCRQSMGGRFLGEGQVLIEVGGEGGVVVLDHVRSPAVLQSIISEQVSNWHRSLRSGAFDTRVPIFHTPPTGTPIVSRSSTVSNTPGAAERLVQLDDLRRRGIVSQEEYARKKRELLDEL
jgi:Bacterial PH domain/Short C-terminal domain